MACGSGIPTSPDLSSRRSTSAPVLLALGRAAQLADLLLTPATDANTLHQQLADQIGARPARQTLAAAHSIAAERLWTETA